MGPFREDASVIMRTPAAEYLIRLRVALPLFGTGRKAEKVARCVRRLTRVLGPARELDVSLLILDELEKSPDVPRPAVDRLRASIADERRRLQEHVRERLDDFDIQKVPV